MSKENRKISTDVRDALIFIDTCILLDFYRAMGRDGELAILGLIDNNHQQIITGEQVEMEYKKNRGELILEALKAFKMPEWGTLAVPAFLKEAEAAKKIADYKKGIEDQVKQIKDHLKKVWEEPSDYDPVYQCLQRLFRAGDLYNLNRKAKEERLRNRIYALARKRYILGYPPRKDKDTSCGDGVNWEWVIHCASESHRNVIIVSRDGDYGTTINGKPVINDWLSWEFSDRVSREQHVVLTDRLTAAFKMTEIAVTPEQIKEEDDVIKARESRLRLDRAQRLWDYLQVMDPSLLKVQEEGDGGQSLLISA